LSLAALKRQIRGLGESPEYAKWDMAPALAKAILFGRWDGENAADKAAMETVLGKSYGEWTETVRPVTLRSDAPLTQRNEKWKVISRAESWAALGPRISNTDLDKFQQAAITVLGERDPKLDLEPDDRFAASVTGKAIRHSTSIRSGIAETLALLGSRPKALTSCSREKPEVTALSAVGTLLNKADWAIWASLNNELPQLAEAAPDEFLDAIESGLLATNNPFVQLFAQERGAFTGGTYMSGLLWALETLAWDPTYLQRVTIILGELAAIDPGGNWTNRPSNSLKDIFLPWHPQTCASFDQRLAALRALTKEQPIVSWKLLLALLPSVTGFTTGTRKPAWRKFIPVDWNENITKRDYRSQVEAYSNFAVELARTDVAKLAELIDRLPYLFESSQARILEHFETSGAALDESTRLPLWEALVDLVRKHRKHPDAAWVMNPDQISRIEKAAATISPNSVENRSRRLFSDREFELYEEIGSYEEQRKELNDRRDRIIAEILRDKHVSGVISFAKQVPSPAIVGLALGRVAPLEIDSELLPDYLMADDKILQAFISNFVWGRFWTRGVQWIDSTFSDEWKPLQKIAFFLYLPFRGDIWTRAESVLLNRAPEYWKEVRVQPYGDHTDLEYAVKRLLEVGRPRAALSCIAQLINTNLKFDGGLAVRALLEAVGSSEPIGALDQYQIVEIVEWLRSNGAPEDDLFRIEWAYLPLFDRHSGHIAEALEYRLASDPGFFSDLIGLVFRSDKESKTEPTPAEQIVAQNAYRLLHSWRTSPGSVRGGGFDDEGFVKWMSEVKQRTSDSGHLKIALIQAGKVLIYAPADPSGLFIRIAVAEALNAKDAESLRNGFVSGLFNERGVHGFSAGKDEMELARRFHRDAEAAEGKGYSRLATSLRELARSYERDAEREANRDPYED
jgi:hypothetical protein